MNLPENPFDSRTFSMLFGGSYVLLGLLLVVFDRDVGEDIAIVTLVYCGIAFLIALVWVLLRSPVEWWRIGLLGVLILAGFILTVALGKAGGSLAVLGVLGAFAVFFTMPRLREAVIFSVLGGGIILAVSFLVPGLDQKPSKKDVEALQNKFDGFDGGQANTSTLPRFSAEPNVFEQLKSGVLSPSGSLKSTSGAQKHSDSMVTTQDVHRALDDLVALAKSSDELNQRGLKLQETGDIDGAIAEFRKAIEVDPTRAETHANLATALRKKGFEEEAQREFAEAKRLRRN